VIHDLFLNASVLSLMAIWCECSTGVNPSPAKQYDKPGRGSADLALRWEIGEGVGMVRSNIDMTTLCNSNSCEVLTHLRSGICRREPLSS
jgi:hypothetical protein